MSMCPAFPINEILSKFKPFIDNSQNYHTVGWITPPSHIYFEIFSEDRDRLLRDIRYAAATIGFSILSIVGYFWQKGKEKNLIVWDRAPNLRARIRICY